MRIHSLHRRIALGLALSMACGMAMAERPATDAMTAPQVRAALEAKGYTDIHDVEFDDGMWKADARSADGQNVDLRIDAATGRIYPEDGVAQLGEADIRAKLSAAGYTNVHDLEFDDGLWKADADDDSGRGIKLRLDASTGAVVGTDRD